LKKIRRARLFTTYRSYHFC